MKIYLGYDGSYVLSPSPLKIERNQPGCAPFLSPTRGKCLDIDGDLVFGKLKLKMFETCKLTVTVSGRKVLK